jgi:hypothetical protein
MTISEGKWTREEGFPRGNCIEKRSLGLKEARFSLEKQGFLTSFPSEKGVFSRGKPKFLPDWKGGGS